MTGFGSTANVLSAPVVIVLVLLAACWVYVSLSPWRTLLAWTATMGIQIEIGQFQLGVSDVLAAPLAVWAVLLMIRPLRLTGVLGGLLAFAGIFCTWSNLMAVLQLGYLPTWTYLNKDVGLAEMLLCIGAIIVIVDSPARLKGLMFALVAGGSILNFAGLALAGTSFLTGFGKFVLYQGVRYTGFMANPNAWALYLVVVMIFQLCLLLLGEGNLLRIPKTLQWANIGLLVAGILLSVSRTGILMLVVGMCCSVFFMSWKRRIVVAQVGLVAGVLLAVTLWQSGISSLVIGRVLAPEGLSSRVAINDAGLAMYTSSAASMVTGIGIGTFIERSETMFGFNNQIHNTFLWILIEGGPLLLAVFVVTIWLAISRIVRAAKVPTMKIFGVAALCSFVSCLVFFMANEGLYQRQFWLLLALPDVLTSIGRRIGVFTVSLENS